jgi:uncharacterized protein (DUF2141 family)
MKLPFKIIAIFFIFMPIKSFAQYSLTVEITGLRNNKGDILYELFDQNQKSLKVGNENISNNKCVIVIDNLKPGKYGFNYIHDENKNKKLDTKMLMIPIEGYGYSNNVDAKFGPPPFKKWIFELKDNMKMNCHPIYLNF